jgi:hypothetical protein
VLHLIDETDEARPIEDFFIAHGQPVLLKSKGDTIPQHITDLLIDRQRENFLQIAADNYRQHGKGILKVRYIGVTRRMVEGKPTVCEILQFDYLPLEALKRTGWFDEAAEMNKEFTDWLETYEPSCEAVIQIHLTTFKPTTGLLTIMPETTVVH